MLRAHGSVLSTKADSSGIAYALGGALRSDLPAVDACSLFGLRPTIGGAAFPDAGADDSWRAEGVGKVLGAGVEVEEHGGVVPPAGLRLCPDVPRPCSATSGRASETAPRVEGGDGQVFPHLGHDVTWHGLHGPACGARMRGRYWSNCDEAAHLQSDEADETFPSVPWRRGPLVPFVIACRFAERPSSSGNHTYDRSEAVCSLRRCGAVQTRHESRLPRSRKEREEEEEDKKTKMGIWIHVSPNAGRTRGHMYEARGEWTKYLGLGITHNGSPAVFCGAILVERQTAHNIVSWRYRHNLMFAVHVERCGRPLGTDIEHATRSRSHDPNSVIAFPGCGLSWHTHGSVIRLDGLTSSCLSVVCGDGTVVASLHVSSYSVRAKYHSRETVFPGFLQVFGSNMRRAINGPECGRGDGCVSRSAQGTLWHGAHLNEGGTKGRAYNDTVEQGEQRTTVTVCVSPHFIIIAPECLVLVCGGARAHGARISRRIDGHVLGDALREAWDDAPGFGPPGPCASQALDLVHVHQASESSRRDNNEILVSVYPPCADVCLRDVLWDLINSFISFAYLPAAVLGLILVWLIGRYVRREALGNTTIRRRSRRTWTTRWRSCKRALHSGRHVAIGRQTLIAYLLLVPDLRSVVASCGIATVHGQGFNARRDVDRVVMERPGGGRVTAVEVQMHHSVESSLATRLIELESTSIGLTADTSDWHVWRRGRPGAEEEQMYPPLELPFVARLTRVESSSFCTGVHRRRRAVLASVVSLSRLVPAETQTYIPVDLPLAARLTMGESVFVCNGVAWPRDIAWDAPEVARLARSIGVRRAEGTSMMSTWAIRRVSCSLSLWRPASRRIGEASHPGPHGARPYDPFDDAEADAVRDDDMDLTPGPCIDQGMHEWGFDDEVMPPAEPDHASGEAGVGDDDALQDALHDPTHLRERHFIAANTFHGQLDGWTFRTSRLGTGYHRERGTITVRLADALPTPPPRTAIALADHLDDACGGRIGPGCATNVWCRARCLLGQTVRRRPRAVPRVRAPRSKRGRRRLSDAHPELGTVPLQWQRIRDRTFVKYGYWAFDTANANCWATARAYLQHTSADFTLLQETRTRRGDNSRSAEDQARRLGWNLALEPCAVTDALLPSAGVAVAVKGHLGMAEPPLLAWDSALSTRACAKWVGACCRGGLFVISGYLVSAKGMAQCNLDILGGIARLLHGLPCPWVLAADFQNTPQQLRSTGWLDYVNGVIVAPTEPTCGDRVIDYFVVSRGLEHSVAAVYKLHDAGFDPHAPIRLLLRASPRSIKLRRMAMPRMIPAMLPTACPPEPIIDDDGIFDGDELPDIHSLPFDQYNIDILYKSWIEAAEGVWYSQMSVPVDTSMPSRARGPRFVWKPAVNGPCGGRTFHSEEAARWRHASRWISQVIWAENARRSDWRLDAPRAAARAKWRLAGLTAARHDDDEAAHCFRSWLREILAVSTTVVALENAVAHAGMMMKQAERMNKSRIDAEWRAYLNGGKCKGLGRQHRFTRGPLGWQPVKVGKCPISGQHVHAPGDDDGVSMDGLRCITMSVEARDAPLGAQQVTEAEADTWGTLWQEEVAIGRLNWPQLVGMQPILLAVEALLIAACSFLEEVGLGWDCWHPRALQRLPRRLLVRLALLLMTAEVNGCWPEAILLNIIVLLRKPEGGYRPIGLMPTLIRLWSRARRSMALEWEQRHARQYFYAGAGRSATVAAWKQAFRAELAHSLEVHYGQVLADLIKCFEYVDHEALVQEAVRMEFPLFLLRLSIASYLMPRSIRVDGVYSRIVIASRGITAGSIFATTELRVLIIRAVDKVVVTVPRAKLTLYVDDLSAESAGTLKTVTEDLERATEAIAEGFLPLGLRLSPHKNVCTASTPSVGKAIADRLTSRKVKFRRQVKSLGIGLGGGRRRNVSVANARLKEFRKKARRYLMLDKGGASAVRVAKTGGVSGMIYGQAVTGVANDLLLRQRRAVAAAVAKGAQGKDINLVLIMADGRGAGTKVDPAFAAHCDSICAWSEALWCGWAARRNMLTALNRAKLRLSKAVRPWSVVYGPAAAVVATAARLEWTFIDEATIRTHDDVTLRLDLESPRAVARYVKAAVERWRWLHIERTYPHLDSGGNGMGALVTPVLDLVERNHAEQGWGMPQRAALKSAICRGQWPQARLAVTGMSISSSCKYCLHDHALHDGCPMDVDNGTAQLHGDEFHRIYICRTSYDRVRRHLAHCDDTGVIDGIDEVRRQAGQAAHSAADARPDNSLPWTRALVPVPRVAIPPPSVDGTWEWHVRPSETPVAGTVYPDASLLDGPSLLFGRFGWSFVIVQGDRRQWEARPDRGGSDIVVLAAAFGAAPAWIQSMPAAEAWALLMATRVAMPSIPYVTDCLENVHTLRKGPRWATAPGRACARVWSVLMAAFDNEDDRLLVEWMPSHLSSATASQRRKSDGTVVTEMDRKSNQLADLLAKRGAACHRVPVAIRNQWKQAVDATHWLALTVGYFTWAANNNDQQPRRDAEPDQGWERTKQRQRRQRPRPPPCQPRPVALGGHRLTKTLDGWRCEVCRSHSIRWARIAPRVCPGSAAARWAARAKELAARAGVDSDGFGGSDGAGHIRFMTDDTTWCDRCGSYADAFAVGLARVCPGRPTCAGKEQHLRRLRRGRHPVTNLPFHGPPVPEPCLGAQHRPSPPPPLRREAWGSGGGGDGQRISVQHRHSADTDGRASHTAEHSRARAAAAAGRIDAVRLRLLRRVRADHHHPRAPPPLPQAAGAGDVASDSRNGGSGLLARQRAETDGEQEAGSRSVRRRITEKSRPTDATVQHVPPASCCSPRGAAERAAEDTPRDGARRVPCLEERRRFHESIDDELLHQRLPPPPPPPPPPPHPPPPPPPRLQRHASLEDGGSVQDQRRGEKRARDEACGVGPPRHGVSPPPQPRRRAVREGGGCEQDNARGEKRALDVHDDHLPRQGFPPRLHHLRQDTSTVVGDSMGDNVREPLLKRSGPVNEAVPMTRRELLTRLAPASGAHIGSPVAHCVNNNGKSRSTGVNAPIGLGAVSSRAELIARLRGDSIGGRVNAADSVDSGVAAAASSTSSVVAPPTPAAPQPSSGGANRQHASLNSHRAHGCPHVDESNSLRSPAGACSARARVVSHVQIRFHRSYCDHMASARSDASASPRAPPD